MTKLSQHHCLMLPHTPCASSPSHRHHRYDATNYRHVTKISQRDILVTISAQRGQVLVEITMRVICPLSLALSLSFALSLSLVSLLSYRGQVFSLCSLIVAYLSLSLSLSLQISQRDQVLFEITMSGGGEGTARARLSLPTHSQRRPPREGGGGAAAEEAEEAEEETHPAVTGRPRAGRFGAARPSHAIRA